MKRAKNDSLAMMLGLLITAIIIMAITFSLIMAQTVAEIKNKSHEIATLTEELEELKSTDHSGGAEIDLDSLFLPIHRDDYIDFSSPYGVRRSPFSGNLAHHSGLDLFGVWHSRIISTGAGTVIEHWIPPGQKPGFRGHDIFGGCLVVQMDDGHQVTFGHLSETYVREGDRVNAGDVIGRQGDTGKSTGEHLHFEVKLDGKEVPPFKYLIGVSQ
jgi:murein DD-endopeptidase MepM/ murein hydrolase activator NlpD